MEYRIGCSGYYYSNWKNKFYPPGLAAREWLAYYCTIFNTLELNGTFYRVPKLASLKKSASTTPDDFRFSVKMNKAITHFHKLNEAKQLITDFQDLIQEGLGNKLSYFLFQLPPSFHYNDENLDRILANIPNEERNVIEFRHPSWWNQTVVTALENSTLTFCNIDFPTFRAPFVHTTPYFYLRLHGSPELFKSSYDISTLIGFYKAFPANSKSCTVFFNNTYYEAGYTNAQQLLSILTKITPGITPE